MGARDDLPGLPPAGRARGLAQDPALDDSADAGRPGAVRAARLAVRRRTPGQPSTRSSAAPGAAASPRPPSAPASVGAAVLGMVAFTGRSGRDRRAAPPGPPGTRRRCQRGTRRRESPLRAAARDGAPCGVTQDRRRDRRRAGPLGRARPAPRAHPAAEWRPPWPYPVGAPRRLRCTDPPRCPRHPRGRRSTSRSPTRTTVGQPQPQPQPGYGAYPPPAAPGYGGYAAAHHTAPDDQPARAWPAGRLGVADDRRALPAARHRRRRWSAACSSAATDGDSTPGGVLAVQKRTAAPLPADNDSIAAVAAKLLPSTVQIIAEYNGDARGATGSGLRARQAGAHHHQQPRGRRGRQGQRQHRGRRPEGHARPRPPMVGRSPVYDIAVLQVRRGQGHDAGAARVLASRCGSARRWSRSAHRSG